MGLFSRTKSCLQLAWNNNDNTTTIEQDNDDNNNLEPTSLWLPPAPDHNDSNMDTKPERLHLPRSCSAPCSLDEHLSKIHRVRSRADTLLALCEEEEEYEYEYNDDRIPVPVSVPTSAATTMNKINRNSCTSSTMVRTKSCNLMDEKVSNSQTCLNVLQGEVAHASPQQTDVMVSADATTCHVVALWSVTTNTTSSRETSSTFSEASSLTIPLASVAHIDDAKGYESCLESMILEHILHHRNKDNVKSNAIMNNTTHQQHHHQQHHSDTAVVTNSMNNAREEEDDDDFGFFFDDDDDMNSNHNVDKDQLSSTAETDHFINTGSSNDHKMIEMQLHIVGGYLDKDGTSQGISNSLIRTFSKFATRYQDQVRIWLSTAAISCMNTSTTTNTPKSRGLGIETKTGKIFPIHSNIPMQWEGPAIDIRSARNMLSPGDGSACNDDNHDNNESSQHDVNTRRRKSLAVIHDTSCGQNNSEIRIQPFQYEPMQQLNVLLKVPDDVLLKVVSTSPDCESQSFCSNFRKTISFVNTVPMEHVFGQKNNPKPLIFSRSTNDLNQWERQQTTQTIYRRQQ